MDLTSSTPTPTLVKTPEPEAENPTPTGPTRIQPAKPSPFTNGVLKRHAPLHLHHHPVVVTYRECLKNHAAGIGGHAVDGCGEFMTSPSTNPTDPTSLKCAACGCHRNFHRREPESPPHAPPLAALEYQPHHRHHPPPPVRTNESSSPNNSPSPPPISSAYYPSSAPHMLVALSHGFSGPPPPDGNTPVSGAANTLSMTPHSSSPNGRKRFRTKFTQDQKGKMLGFADKVGWKMQKREEDLISNFCNEIGVDKGVFKVWMHNNKNTFGKKEDHQHPMNTISVTAAANGNDNGSGYAPMGGTAAAGTDFPAASFHHHHHRESNNDSKHSVHGTNNGSSSSS